MIVNQVSSSVEAVSQAVLDTVMHDVKEGRLPEVGRS